MFRFRFTLAALMGATAIAALICATLVLLLQTADGHVVEVMLIFGTPLVILEAGLLGVVFGHGLTRRFWIGYELCGWLAWGLLFVAVPLWLRPIQELYQRAYDHMAGHQPSQFGPFLGISYVIRDWGEVMRSLEWCTGLPFIVVPPLTAFIGGRLVRKHYSRRETVKNRDELRNS